MPASGARTLVFARAARLWGLDASVVRSVIPAPLVTRVPGVEGALLGLVGYQGGAVPLVDPGALERGARGVSGGVSGGARAALVVHCDAGPLGIAADEVLGFDDYAGAVSLLDPARVYRRAADAVRRAQRAP